MMFGCNLMNTDCSEDDFPSVDTFSLPAPLPEWPPGQGFGHGKINLGEIEVIEITKFKLIWNSHQSRDKRKGVSFYKPIHIPSGYFSLGHYCQPNNTPLSGFILAAKRSVHSNHINKSEHSQLPALLPPCDYSLVWNSDDVYFWLPESPPRYKSLGYVVTNTPEKPNPGDIGCVRDDLVDKCESCGLLLETCSKFRKIPFKVWKIRPCDRGIFGRGVPTGTFSCGDENPISCLKNLDPNWNAMSNLDQIHELIHHYGPTVFFHPKEIYLPSSVSWFFANGVRICKTGHPDGEPINVDGSNLPSGGRNDGEFWLDFPCDEKQKELIKHGNLESSELYVHVKPALGGTFTDLAMWVFAPFNGPATLKIGPTNISLTRTGEHVGDWEHFTLRISNFTGKLHSIYFSQHSGGVWVNAFDLEFINRNQAVIYSSKNGHASYPHPGCYLQGNSKIGIGIRNDCGRSNLCVDSSVRYKIVAAEYLGESLVVEPCWLQFMREWGPKIVYGSRKELDKMIKRLPVMIRDSIRKLVDKFPAELSGEEGPTGPKEKNNWFGDERW